MTRKSSGLLKWAGGKEREMPVLIQYLPESIDNYYEPFVGGGSVFLSIAADSYHVNDLYDELYAFYELCITGNKSFKRHLERLDELWLSTTTYFDDNADMFNAFIESRHKGACADAFASEIAEDFYSKAFKDKYKALSKTPIDFKLVIKKVFEKKINRICAIEGKSGLLSSDDLQNNFKSGLKAAVYTYIRAVYNYFRLNRPKSNDLYIACFYFIRNYCYSSMFRFNALGEFNVPYGGLSYNENYMTKKIAYIYSERNLEKYRNSTISNLDFSEFLADREYTVNDFIFLDPPYDTEFSSYAQNTFDRADQERLAESLVGVKAKWMMVTKHTDFIEELYTRPGINIERFAKKYQVSIQNRNNQDACHLVIRNYL